MGKVSVVFIAIFLLLASGCGEATTPSTSVSVPSASTPSTSAAGTADSLPQPVLASSELVVGQERFVFGIIDPKTKQPIQDVPDVSIQFFKVNDDGTATKVGDATPIFRSKNLPTGVYVVRTSFDKAGNWGALMEIKREGHEPYQVKANFQVSSQSTVPMPGQDAPKSENMTTKDADIDEICSSKPHDDMHDLTIAAAVTSGKPTLILFAAPGFCPSFTCGPDLELVQTLESQYRGKANFIHIESPNEIQNHTHTGKVDPNHNQEAGHQGVAKPQVQTAKDWGLKTEPWLFLVDKNGKVMERFEGGLTLDEVQPEFEKLIR